MRGARLKRALWFSSAASRLAAASNCRVAAEKRQASCAEGRRFVVSSISLLVELPYGDHGLIGSQAGQLAGGILNG